MSGDLDLEQRYRRVLRLLPGYYRDKREEDMVAAFLDSWLTGDPEEDEAILKFCRPTWPEVASVVRPGRPAVPGRYGRPTPVLAMAAFHRDAPPAASRPWLLALPATYLAVGGDIY